MATAARPTISRTLSLPARPTAHLHHRRHLQCLQTRHQSSNRRARKMNNIAPAPVTGGSSLPTAASGKSRTAKEPLPETDHIVYNPPSSAPNVYHTPPKFLPKTDIRWKLYQQQRLEEDAAAQKNSPSASLPQHPTEQHNTAQTTTLPKPVTTPYQKSYHLTPDDFAEMRKLRESDEEHWTRSRLAQRFQCTQFFAGMVTQASQSRQEKLKKEQESWEDWARRKNPALLKIREDRLKRKARWTHEV